MSTVIVVVGFHFDHVINVPFVKHTLMASISSTMVIFRGMSMILRRWMKTNDKSRVVLPLDLCTYIQAFVAG